MGRWTRSGIAIVVEKGIGCGLDSLQAKAIIAAHNADCDTYEARIAELTAELARVKAESLRNTEANNTKDDKQ